MNKSQNTWSPTNYYLMVNTDSEERDQQWQRNASGSKTQKKKKLTRFQFRDISAAFDTDISDLLIRKLRQYDINGKNMSMIQILLDRT